MDIHPFWRGFYSEIEKISYVAPAALSGAVELAQEHPVAASAAVAGAGLGAIALKRKLFNRAPAAAAASHGFGLKGLLLAGGVGALGGYMAGSKKREE
jgi:hypothetical protein